jgi:alkanesulfonate monooxygenase
MSAFIIARSTDEEAQAELERLTLLQARDTDPYWKGILAGNDPDTVMFKTFEKYPHVGTNGGTAAGLVGSYDTVAKRIAAFTEVGVETFMLQFYPFARELERFAEEVKPRVQRLQPVA